MKSPRLPGTPDHERLLTSKEALKLINEKILPKQQVDLGPAGCTYIRLWRASCVYPHEMGVMRLTRARSPHSKGRGGGMLFRKGNLERFQFSQLIKNK